MFRRSSVFASLLLAMSVASAAEFSSLEERMSEQEFRAAGLDRLSAEELAALNQWLRTKGAAAGAAAASDRVGFKSGGGLLGDNSGQAAIEGVRIRGPFSGWDPGQVIELNNGQAWRIDDDRGFSVPAVNDPLVEIEPAMLGSWLMRVEGYNRTARVTRVR
jgi:hypothetical protein